jgi:hypothetical protein
MRKIAVIIIMFCALAAIASAEKFTYETGVYEKYDNAGYELLAINNGEQWESDGQLNEPVTLQKYQISSDKAIKEVKIIKKSDSIKLSINLPQIDYGGDEFFSFVERECLANERDAFMTYDDEHGKESFLNFEIHPLEITDCENGKFTLYRKMEIEVEYYDENKIKSVSPSEFKPGEEATIKFEFENLKGENEIIIKDDWGSEVVLENVYSEEETYIVDIPEDTEDIYFTIEFYEGGEIVDRAVISQDLDWGSVDFRVLVSEDDTVFPLAIEIKNAVGEEIAVGLVMMSLNMDGEAETTKTETVDASPGNSIHYFNLEAGEDGRMNDISVEATYNGITEYIDHNSLVRSTHDEVKDGLPLSPGEELAKDLVDIAAGTYEDGESEGPAEATTKSNLIGILAAVIMFCLIGYIAFKYLRKRD